MSSSALRALRRVAADRTLFAPLPLPDALERLGFVQADPIRAPARAQDLILRHRVPGYRAGDLERAYASLPLVEEMIHVYGFLLRRHRGLLHPRRIVRRFHVEEEHPHLRRAVLEVLAQSGGHPRQVELALAERHPRTAIVNAWGGQSSATTRMLEVLHYRGLLDVVRRERGIRVYGLADATTHEADLSPRQRADGLIGLLVDLYAPLSRSSLLQLTLMLRQPAAARDALRARIPVLLKKGTLRSTRIDGVDYLWPGVDPVDDVHRRSDEPVVRFLAPFDPLVWDRRRFDHLWQWRYRFEAYVPADKRQLGYYALPLLWDTTADAQVIGWVNVTRQGGRLDVKAGYVGKRPGGPVYRAAFDAEIARLEAFLGRDEAADAVESEVVDLA